MPKVYSWTVTTIVLLCVLQLSSNHLFMEFLKQPTQARTYTREALLLINDTVKQQRHRHPLPYDAFQTARSLGLLNVKPTRRGKKAGLKHKQKLQTRANQYCNGLSLFSLNCQSVKSKSTHGVISDIVVEHDIDIFALTETWLADDESDEFDIKSLTPEGYDLFNVPRGGGDPHGGIALLYKKGIKVVSTSPNQSSPSDRTVKSFEHCKIVFSSGSKCFTLVVIYRPPPSVKNQLTMTMFFEEFSELLLKGIWLSLAT